MNQKQAFIQNSKKALNYFRVAGIIEILWSFLFIASIVVVWFGLFKSEFILPQFNIFKSENIITIKYSMIVSLFYLIFGIVKLIMLILGLVNTSELRKIARMNYKIMIYDAFAAGIIGIFLPIATYFAWYKAAKIKNFAEKFCEDFIEYK